MEALFVVGVVFLALMCTALYFWLLAPVQVEAYHLVDGKLSPNVVQGRLIDIYNAGKYNEIWEIEFDGKSMAFDKKDVKQIGYKHYAVYFKVYK